MSFALALASALLLATAAAQAQTTWYVDDDNCPGPGSGTKKDPFCSIQDAIDAASDGDQIIVAPGTYNETVGFDGTAVTLRSSGGRDVTVIDGSGLGVSVVTFTIGDGPDTVLQGFTVTGASAFAGAAMLNENGSPTITDCLFSNNTATLFGGGFFSFGGNPTLINCWFHGNSADAGGAMVPEDSEPTLINCVFSENTATFGGAMSNSGGSATFSNCTFYANTASSEGGAMINSEHIATLVNCVLWGNSPDEISDDQVSLTTVLYSDVQGGWAGEGWGNIDADPMFVDPANDDLRLQSGSPCADAGNNWGLPVDADDRDGDGNTAEMFPLDQDGNPRFAADEIDFDPGCGVPVVVDMGAYEYQGGPSEVIFADTDGDGVVGIIDFLAALAAWGPCGPECCLADFDIDGSVGIAEFLAVLDHWGP
jgi:predicted outer membrane repeat protein